MSFLEWIKLIQLALKFPASVRSLVLTLEGTNDQELSEIVKGTQKLAETMRTTGRPVWEKQ